MQQSLSNVWLARLSIFGLLGVVVFAVVSSRTNACVGPMLIGSLVNDEVEKGSVKWSRDLASAKVESTKSGKPVFLLFQEIPG